ncbi:hypothetical protein DYBT9275_04018 [Dyadobacter sp. CECT 9275]|uniref:DUF7847 domain-containing protein n=1 Tax=Dyadobacter helix TaxID=2822344 RepID=A0A916N775_9BACT|nr:hypothetical protein [Dyadobacter sp. CECT 9275]CAG5007309.1 hypothetical protein DYBT9275_04018 [Dyadobacter sp. CECT 9275]
MITPQIKLLQQRDFGKKINTTFDFARQNFKPLLAALAFIAGPSALLSGVAQGVFQSNMLDLPRSMGMRENFTLYFSTGYLIVLVFSMLTSFLSFSVVVAYITLYEKGEYTITPAMVWQKIAENLVTGLTAAVVSFLLTILATLVLVLPGIYVAVCLQLFLFGIIREGLSATDALKRSYALVKTDWWATFGLLLVMSVVSAVLSFVFQIPLYIVTMLNTLGLSGELASLKPIMVFSSVLSIVGSTLVQGLIWISLGFQYFNLVEKVDRTGLWADVEQLGNPDHF